MKKLHAMPVHELSGLLSDRKISAREAAQAHLDRIDAFAREVNCYITVTPETALAQADAAQKRIDAGTAGPLTGIPMAFKDNMCTEGIRTTCASKMLEHFIPPYSATVVSKLHREGIVMLGKLNMDEFAMGSTNETPFLVPCATLGIRSGFPVDPSGGSAAAVAAGLAPYTLGSDTEVLSGCRHPSVEWSA